MQNAPERGCKHGVQLLRLRLRFWIHALCWYPQKKKKKKKKKGGKKKVTKKR